VFFVVPLCLAPATSRAAAAAGDVSFVRVWPGWRESESFDRISEYFGGGENHGPHIVLRTHAETRAGYYFLVRVKNSAAPAAAQFSLHVITPAVPEPKNFSFPATLAAGESVFQLGLTAADWPGGKKSAPVAWRLDLLAPDGRVLATQQSFLWSK
jgi:hypothetical protein